MMKKNGTFALSCPFLWNEFYLDTCFLIAFAWIRLAGDRAKSLDFKKITSVIKHFTISGVDLQSLEHLNNFLLIKPLSKTLYVCWEKTN